MSALDLRRYNYEHHYGFQRTDCAPPPPDAVTSDSRIYNETDTVPRQLRRPIPVRCVLQQQETPLSGQAHRCACNHDIAPPMHSLPRSLGAYSSSGTLPMSRAMNHYTADQYASSENSRSPPFEFGGGGSSSAQELSGRSSRITPAEAASGSESSAGARCRHKNFENQRQQHHAVTTPNGQEQKYSASRLNIYDNNVNNTKLDEIVEDNEGPPLPPRPPLRPRSTFHQRNREGKLICIVPSAFIYFVFFYIFFPCSCSCLPTFLLILLLLFTTVSLTSGWARTRPILDLKSHQMEKRIPFSDVNSCIIHSLDGYSAAPFLESCAAYILANHQLPSCCC